MTWMLRTILAGLSALILGGRAPVVLGAPPSAPSPKGADTTRAAKAPRVYFLVGDSLREESIREARRTAEEADQRYQEALRELQENARRFSGTVVTPPLPPDEVILPDTVYTTEVTIGPEGIEYYDSTGTKHTIHGRPVSPDMPFVLGEKSGRPITRQRASEVVQFGVDIHVARDERVEGNVVAIGGNVVVEGEVNGDVVAIFGDVTVDGYVHGSAVAPMGKAQINPGGVVRRDIAASVIEQAPGSMVGGNTSYTGVRLPGGVNLVRGFTFAYLLFHIGLAVFTVFLVLLGHVFAAKNIVAIRERIGTNGIKSFIIGLLTEFLGIPILFILLLITVIGIPVALLVLPVAVVVAIVLGFAGFGLLMGEKVADNTGFRLPTQLGKTVAGVAAMLLVVVLGALLVLTFGSPLSVVGWVVFVIGHAVVFITVTTGLGAVVLTRFGTRPRKALEPKFVPTAAIANPSSPPPGEPFATPTS